MIPKNISKKKKRDLSARNVLLREKTLECVVCDFGLSRKVQNNQNGGTTKSMVGPVRVNTILQI